MDFPSFLDFYLAWENKKDPVSVAYFFKVLDLQKRGFLVQADMYMLFKKVHQNAGDGAACIVIEDVIDEVFDMIMPVDPLRIKQADLAGSKMSDIFITCLADAYGFIDYDQREFNMHTEDEEAS